MHETIDTTVQADKDAKIGDRLDLAGNLVTTIDGRGKFCPRIRFALLDAQRNPATLFIDLE